MTTFFTYTAFYLAHYSKLENVQLPIVIYIINTILRRGLKNKERVLQKTFKEHFMSKFNDRFNKGGATIFMFDREIYALACIFIIIFYLQGNVAIDLDENERQRYKSQSIVLIENIKSAIAFISKIVQ